MLFTPFTLPGGSMLKNRLVLAPMTTYSSNPDGSIAQDELPYYQRRAAGGFGMVITAACYVHKSGHAFEGQWSCSRDEDIPSLRSVAQAIHTGGSIAALQIHHGGRECPSRLCGHQPWSASDVKADRPSAETPRPMETNEIREIVESFGQAGRRAVEAGFDAIEIHGANTYLLQQFVSATTNKRLDLYGQDRYLFALDVTEAVFSSVGGRIPIGYRLSPEETGEDGISLGQTFNLLDRLLTLPLAWIHVSLSQWNQASVRGDFNEPTLALLRRHIGSRAPLMGVGSIRSASDAEDALSLCDLIAVGKCGITEPEFGQKCLTGELIRRTVPASGAAEQLTLPAGLERQIYAESEWFEVEPIEPQRAEGQA